jgi:nicotinamide mononucleotide transporter
MTKLLRLDVFITLALTILLVLVTQYRWFGQYSPTGQVEVAAVVFTGLSVWLAVKNSVWNWVAGIVGCGLYLYLFWGWRLYADSGLQIFYIAISLVGLYAWIHRRQVGRPEAQKISLLHLFTVLVSVAVGTLLVREYLITVSDAAPFWDAFLTSGSIGAQYLLIRKYIENWYMWAVLDAAYIILFINRQFYLTAVLYAIFFVMVIFAAFEWRRYLPRLEGKPA